MFCYETNLFPLLEIKKVAKEEGVEMDEESCNAIVDVSQGDLRKAITALQVAATIDKNLTRDLIYETTATAPPSTCQRGPPSQPPSRAVGTMESRTKRAPRRISSN